MSLEAYEYAILGEMSAPYDLRTIRRNRRAEVTTRAKDTFSFLLPPIIDRSHVFTDFVVKYHWSFVAQWNHAGADLILVSY